MTLLRSSADRAAVPARQPRRRGAGLAVVLVCGLALAGCKVDNTPASYDASPVIRDNFMQTCTGNIPNASTTTKLASQDQCGCSYDVFVKMVPYDDAARDNAQYKDYPRDKPTFQALEASLKDDPNKMKDLPQPVQDALNRCKTTPGTAATGTTPPEGTQPR